MKNNFNYWLMIFIVLLFMIPIFSIESLIPWTIFLFFSSLSFKLKEKDMHLSRKILTGFLYCFIAGGLGISFNYLVTKGTQFVISMFL